MVPTIPFADQFKSGGTVPLQRSKHGNFKSRFVNHQSLSKCATAGLEEKMSLTLVFFVFSEIIPISAFMLSIRLLLAHDEHALNALKLLSACSAYSE